MRAARLLLAALFLLTATAVAPAGPLPLAPAEQEAVNRSIERGVRYLKDAQHEHGGWTAARESHAVGYVALPALTLLQCGVPAKDRAVQRARSAVRRAIPHVDTTYELSLAILFLDQLDDPRDRDLIQSLAVRLIVGQTATGGWGYKCPTVPRKTQRDILVALRKLNPERPGFAVNRPPPRRDRPGWDGPEARGPGRRPGDFPVDGKAPPGGRPGLPVDGGAKKPGDVPLDGKPAPGRDFPEGGERPGPRPVTGTEGGTERSVGETTVPPAGSHKAPAKASETGREPAEGPLPKGPGAAPRPEDRAGPGPDPRRWARCIKSSEWHDDWRDRPAEGARAEEGKATPLPKPAPLTVVPVGLRPLPVFQDPALMLLQDPKGRANKPLLSTTDNSNTQFAILALLAAQRHDVPMARSLNLLVRRFQTSQNADGSWGYHYLLGGGLPEQPPMTAVGLLGLAVGHGLAGNAGEKKVNDPAILKGLAALSKHVGPPAGRMHALPQPNLYLLFSIERVGVLYDLPRIAGKDWYRWGAEALVANQEELGNWNKGGYPGATRACDTCLALLFLKRANLAVGLRENLPFDPEELERKVLEQGRPPAPSPPDEEEVRRKKAREKAKEKARKAREEEEEKARAARAKGERGYPEGPPRDKASPSSAPPARPTVETAGPSTSPNATQPEARGGKRWLWLLLMGLGAMLLGGAAACVMVHLRRNRTEVDPEAEPAKRPKRRAGKRPPGNP